MEEERVHVCVDGKDMGTASRACLERWDADEDGIYANAELELFDLTQDLEKHLNQEMLSGKCSFILVLEFPDGRRFHGTNVGPKELVAGKYVTLFVSRGGWGQ
jgi:hypothetical protein